MLCFLVKVVGVGNACCFRFMRVAKRNGDALVGAVLGDGAFAKTMPADLRPATPSPCRLVATEPGRPKGLPFDSEQ